MERLNYTLVIISTKGIKSVCRGIWFNDTTAANQYAEGITAGLALAGKKNCAVIMHTPGDDELKENATAITKNLTNKHRSIYWSDYIWA